MVLVILIGSLLVLVKVRTFIRSRLSSDHPSISTKVLEEYIESAEGNHCCSGLKELVHPEAHLPAIASVTLLLLGKNHAKRICPQKRGNIDLLYSKFVSAAATLLRAVHPLDGEVCWC